ncbi:MAG: hypothetical protein FWD73_16100 [Polyangiaceae bacterium]|nr:hypothetical protein [Polyangiaceae bacterium]
MSGRSASAFSALAALMPMLGLSACGYRPLYGGAAAGEKYAVVLASSKIPDAIAADEVLAGVREEFARRGALAAGDGFPHCEVEVLRADEDSDAIAAVPNADGRLIPMSRATRVSIVARAWVVWNPQSPIERDTGDMRAFETVATAADVRAAVFQHDDARRAAGRRVGRILGARILGLPAVSED